tara:strand:- start:805 stop:1389 length:585 start_codon:yes stop_codon:yes gene_type:complete
MVVIVASLDGAAADRGSLLGSITLAMRENMWASGCDDYGALRKTCFTAESCCRHRTSRPMAPAIDDEGTLTLVAVKDGTPAGWLQAEVRVRNKARVLFVFNVCTIEKFRRTGIARQLFAHLARVYKGPFELTVFSPHRCDDSKAKRVSAERLPKLMRMYGRLGFSVVGADAHFVRMRAAHLRTEPPSGRRFILR